MVDFKKHFHVRYSQGSVIVSSCLSIYNQDEPYHISVDFTLKGKRRINSFLNHSDEFIPAELSEFFEEGVPIIFKHVNGTSISFTYNIFLVRNEEERAELINKSIESQQENETGWRSYYYKRLYGKREHPERLPCLIVDINKDNAVEVLNNETETMGYLFLSMLHRCIRELK